MIIADTLGLFNGWELVHSNVSMKVNSALADPTPYPSWDEPGQLTAGDWGRGKKILYNVYKSNEKLT